MQNLEFKIYVVQKFKKQKIKNHSDMFRILCDPSSGGTELCLTEIIRTDSHIFCRILGRCLAAYAAKHRPSTRQNVCESVRIISVKQSSVPPDDGSHKIRNMSE